MELCQERRGVYKDMKYVDPQRVDLHYELPLNEIIYDFFDALKSPHRAATPALTMSCWATARADLVKLDILLNGEVVDALSFIVHADRAYGRGRRMCEKLKETIPRQLFEVPIQAAIGGKIIARETVKAMRKDVLAKCYGGDITRKKKLLEKQKEGKKRMRSASAPWRSRRRPSCRCSSSTTDRTRRTQKARCRARLRAPGKRPAAAGPWECGRIPVCPHPPAGPVCRPDAAPPKTR